MRRFYLPHDQIRSKAAVITGADAHHLRDVLRLRISDRIIIFDGTGAEYQAKITSIDRTRIVVAIGAVVTSVPDPTCKVTLAQGYLKDKKMDQVVRQMTELGVHRWVPFLSLRSVPLPDKNRLMGRYRRWNKISLEALKQCGRSRTMEISPLVTFEEALAMARDNDEKVIFYEESKSASLANEICVQQPKSLFVMVGPEGGFAPEEVSSACRDGFRRMGLGPRVLRAETAAVAAAVVSQYMFGDMGAVVPDKGNCNIPPT